MRLALRQRTVSVLNVAAAGKGSSEAIDDLAKQSMEMPGADAEGDVVWAFCAALRALTQAVQWEPAILRSEPNPDRFRVAARLAARRALETRRTAPWPDALSEALSTLAQLGEDPDEVRSAADLLARTALPARFRPSRSIEPLLRFTPPDQPPGVPVTLRLTVAGRPPATLHSVVRDEVLSIEVALAGGDWPVEAAALRVRFASSYDQSLIYRGDVSIPRGSAGGDCPLVLRAEFGDERPAELTVLAEFETAEGTAILARPIGDRALRLITAHGVLADLADLPLERQKVVTMMETLRQKLPGLPRADHDDVEKLLVSTIRFAHRVWDGEIFKPGSIVSEAAFQKEIRQHFRVDHRIGRRLAEAAKQGGGTTDVALGRIVDELKFEDNVEVTLDRAPSYTNQATQYASAGGCPVAVLTIFDASAKHAAPGVMANLIDWFVAPVHGAPDPAIPSLVAAVIIPGGFDVPSAFSKMSTGTGPKSGRTERVARAATRARGPE